MTNGLCHECFRRGVRGRLLASSPVLLEELESTLRGKLTVTAAAEAFLGALRVRLVTPRRFLEWLDGNEQAQFVDDTEMTEIQDDDALIRRLRTGSRQARRRKGHLVD